ncbi:hypothetical protein BDY24DRAFT_414388 [Mrakia frigida]|uniref:uncharacterized protein n=1 Tax=Mrakia frigida TaxID=29902 RepID=UPI003FCBFF8F
MTISPSHPLLAKPSKPYDSPSSLDARRHLPITTCNTRPRRRRFSPSHRPPSSPRQLFDLPNGLILPNLNALQSFRYPPVTSSEVLTTSSLVLRRLDWDRCSSSLSHGLGKDAFEGGRRGTAEEGSREPGMLAQQDCVHWSSSSSSLPSPVKPQRRRSSSRPLTFPQAHHPRSYHFIIIVEPTSSSPNPPRPRHDEPFTSSLDDLSTSLALRRSIGSLKSILIVAGLPQRPGLLDSATPLISAVALKDHPTALPSSITSLRTVPGLPLVDSEALHLNNVPSSSHSSPSSEQEDLQDHQPYHIATLEDSLGLVERYEGRRGSGGSSSGRWVVRSLGPTPGVRYRRSWIKPRLSVIFLQDLPPRHRPYLLDYPTSAMLGRLVVFAFVFRISLVPRTHWMLPIIVYWMLIPRSRGSVRAVVLSVFGDFEPTSSQELEDLGIVLLT